MRELIYNQIRRIEYPTFSFYKNQALFNQQSRENMALNGNSEDIELFYLRLAVVQYSCIIIAINHCAKTRQPRESVDNSVVWKSEVDTSP